MRKEPKVIKHSICITDDQSIDDLAACQRLYSEIHGELPPTCPKIVGLALQTLRKILKNRLESDLEAKSKG